MKTSSQQLARAIRALKKTPRKQTVYSVKSGRAPDWSRSDQRRTTGRWNGDSAALPGIVGVTNTAGRAPR